MIKFDTNVLNKKGMPQMGHSFL